VLLASGFYQSSSIGESDFCSPFEVAQNRHFLRSDVHATEEKYLPENIYEANPINPIRLTPDLKDWAEQMPRHSDGPSTPEGEVIEDPENQPRLSSSYLLSGEHIGRETCFSMDSKQRIGWAVGALVNYRTKVYKGLEKKVRRCALPEGKADRDGRWWSTLFFMAEAKEKFPELVVGRQAGVR